MTLIRTWLMAAAAFGAAIPLGYWMRSADGLSGNTATLLAGLGGGAIGGLVSYLTAQQATKLALARDENDRISRENASALNVLVTSMQISNRLYTFSLNLAPAAEASDLSEPWQRFQASPEQDPPKLHYAPADFVPFINAQAADLVHRCFLLAERHDSIDASFRTYGRLRLELENFLVPHSKLSGGVMDTAIPPEHYVRSRYLMDQLNSLIMQMHKFTCRDLGDAKQIIIDANAAYRSYFGENATFALDFDDTTGSTQTDPGTKP